MSQATPDEGDCKPFRGSLTLPDEKDIWTPWLVRRRFSREAAKRYDSTRG